MASLGQITAGIAHEINNPLGGLLNCVSNMQDDPHNTELQVRYLPLLDKGLHQIESIMRQLLNFGRIAPLQLRQIDIDEEILECMSLLRYRMKNIDLELVLGIEQPLCIDCEAIKQIVVNIGLNAIQAMPDGGRLTITSSKSPENIMLEFKDTGIGIEEEIKSKIFDPFFTTKEQGKGTGMGMASVYGTIKNHNGAIEIRSTPGKGTAITVLLPLHNRQKHTAGEPEITVSTQRNGHAHILLVDDEDLVIDTARSMLQKSGYTVTVCKNGRETVEYFRSNHDSVDLVLLDLIMPEMNGSDTFKTLREINPTIKVVISSGYSIDSEAQSLLDKGAGDFIQKPYRRHELDLVIRQVLKNS